METVNIRYDKEEDILFLYKEQRPKGSIEIGDFVISFTEHMHNVTAVEILDASKVLSTTFNTEITPDMLCHIQRAHIRTEHRRGRIAVLFGIAIKNMQQEQAFASFIPLRRAVQV